MVDEPDTKGSQRDFVIFMAKECRGLDLLMGLLAKTAL